MGALMNLTQSDCCPCVMSLYQNVFIKRIALVKIYFFMMCQIAKIYILQMFRLVRKIVLH